MTVVTTDMARNHPIPVANQHPTEDLATPFEVAGTAFTPLADRGLFWQSQNTLMVADLHLGKEATFCASGIAVPRGSTGRTLQCVEAMLRQTQSSRLIILGDLFHAKSSLAPDVREQFIQFLDRCGAGEVILVRGNHDRSAGTLPSDWPLVVVEEPLVIDQVELAHFPGPPTAPNQLRIAGHLHPGVVLGRPAGGRKLPCFHYSAHDACLTLPAAGDFTGTARVRPSGQDRVWIAAENTVIEVDLRHLA